MTRMVPRPDWTPEEARVLFFALSDYFVTLQAGINDPARVLGMIDALFRPAEEPGIITATADHARPLEPIPWDDDYPRETPAPVAPPPAEEREECCFCGQMDARCYLIDVRPHSGGPFKRGHPAGSQCITALRSELSASQRDVAAIRAERDKVESSYRFMLQRAAAAENERDRLRAEWIKAAMDSGSPPAGGTAG